MTCFLLITISFFYITKNGKWYGHDKYCFVKPIAKKRLLY